MSDALNKRSVGRWAVALAATAAFMVGDGYPGSVGSVQAGDEPGSIVGSPGQDGQDVTCQTYDNVTLQHDGVLTCNVVGGDGENGAPGLTAQAADDPSNQGGPPGAAGKATNDCPPSVRAQDDAIQVVCEATPGKPGAPGQAL